MVGLSPAIEALLRECLRQDHTILDVGCGDGGHYGELVCGLVRTCYGLDIAPNAVERAKSRGILALVHALDRPLPFADRFFDGAICLEVLEHLISPESVVRELSRVIKPNGCLIVGVPNIGHFSHRIRVLCGKFVAGGSPLTADKPWADPHIRFFAKSSLASMLRQCGFRPTICLGDGAGLLTDFPGVSGVLVRLLSARRVARLSEPFEFLARLYPPLFAGHLVMVARRP